MTTAEFHEEWFGTASQDVLAKLVEQVRDVPGVIVEFGAWEGRSSVALANAAFPRIVHSVDPWDGRGHPMSAAIAAERDIGAQWAANMETHTKGNYEGHRMGWEDFVPTITEPVALCFIDADHSYQAVFDNIVAMLPHMTPGGVMCGDDMHHGPVQDALLDLFGPDDVYMVATVWVWNVPTDPVRLDHVRLRALDMRLAPTPNEVRCDLDRVARLWRHYVGATSTLDHAAGIGTIAYLYRLCDVVQPKTILDLGSGLSSAVFRKWKQETGSPVKIVSVDTDAEWLEKTRKFIIDNELPEETLTLHKPITGRYDLIFHDLAGGELREQVAHEAARVLNDGGVIVFDDAHHPGHRVAYETAAAENGIQLFSLELRLRDAINRYPLLGIKNGHVSAPVSPLRRLYEQHAATPSDIYEHLPKFVQMVKDGQVTKVIELGTRTGVSTIAWLYALEQTGGHLWSVDIDTKPAIGDYPHWTFIQGDDESDVVLSQLPDQVDIVFLDTSHHYEHTLRELRLYRSQVRPGGLIVCHDTQLDYPEGAPPSDPRFPVKRAIEQFIRETGFRWVNHPECWGLGIIEVV